MKLVDIKIESIKENKKINSRFINSVDQKSDIICNILKDNFYLDTHSFYPITKDRNSFSEIFSWGDKKKYDNFYSKKFLDAFDANLSNLKKYDNIFVLGSSSQDNYYRNLITYLPRIFFCPENEFKLAIHRNSSNKIREFILSIFKKLNKKIQFIYLDDGFYNFSNSKIPQFFNKKISIKLMNRLRNKENSNKIKLYISRQNCSYRNLINENDIIKKLNKKGFQTIDLKALSIDEQINLFSSAEIIISPTGSALANIIFCDQGTKIIELSPKYKFIYEETFKNRYSFIAQTLGLNYSRIEADPINIKNHKEIVTNTISPNVLNESNYYKDLILKLEEFDNFKDY